MIVVCKNVWLLPFPLKRFGWDIRRNVTVIRLSTGRLILHSTGPFRIDEIKEIRDLGEVNWIIEAMLRHDTFSSVGHAVFPEASFLAPEGFSKQVGFFTHSIAPPPLQWAGEFEVLELEGIPTMRETVCFHVPSRTLIVADLIFNFPQHEALWSELMLKAAVGNTHRPSISRPFRLAVIDEPAFRRSIARMMRWNFDRVIVGHGEMITTDGHAKVFRVLQEAGYTTPAEVSR